MMKIRHILHWAMGVVMTPLLGSCAADGIGDAGRDGCDIILGQPMAVTSVTRATDGSTSSNQFEQDEIVWLWAKKTTDGSEYIQAWKLTAQSGGSFSGSTQYWPSDGSSLDVYALHGNFKNSTITENSTGWSSLSLTHTVEDDQSSDVNKRLSDLLYSHPSSAVVPNSGSVQLTFNHLLAKITVKLDLNGSKGIEASELANATVTLTNIQPDATFTSSNGEAASACGSRTPIKAGIISSSINSGSVIGSAIVPLQTFGGGKSDSSDDNVITIKLASPDSRSFSYKPTSNVALTAGNEYIYTLKIIGKHITGTLSVSPFTSESESIPFNDYFDYLADLKNRNYLGSSSDPHDLSYDYNGQMNTANCYVVTHPGYYKFPLVYGNAIKNGATNSIAYGVDENGARKSNTFVDHNGNVITDPYITKNYTANTAELVWQDAKNLISNIALCDGNTYISFEITKENIEQGNAVIAVKDVDGTIMWSWHIWVTNKNVYETQAVTASYQSTTQTFMFMPFPLGWNDSNTTPTCTFYQWGRKDPLPPSNPTMANSAQTDIKTSIQNPLTFYGTGTDSWENTSALDLWNVGNTVTTVNFNTVTKSVYDPSPAGFHLPCTAAFTGFTSNGSSQSGTIVEGQWDSTNLGFKFTNGTETYWQACGYRAYNSGSLYDVGSAGLYWSAGPSNTTNGRYLGFSSSGNVDTQYGNVRAHGFSVRPVSE